MPDGDIDLMARRETGIRTTIRIPQPVHERLEEISNIEVRSISSVITEACLLFLANKRVDEATDKARKSPEYKKLISEINKEKQGK